MFYLPKREKKIVNYILYFQNNQKWNNTLNFPACTFHKDLIAVAKIAEWLFLFEHENQACSLTLLKNISLYSFPNKWKTIVALVFLANDSLNQPFKENSFNSTDFRKNFQNSSRNIFVCYTHVVLMSRHTNE